MSDIIPYQTMEAMANTIAKSNLFGIKRPEEALALMLVAQAEGRHPAIIARDYHIIQGRPALRADAMLARFQESGGRVEWLSLTDERVEAKFTHPQGSATISWDLARAKAADIGGRDMWRKYPRQMLRSRVISEGIRTVFPACVCGTYEVEEVRDMVPAERQVDAVVTTPAATQEPAAPVVMASADDQKSIMEMVSALGWSGPHASNWLKKHFGCASRAQLTAEQAPKVVAALAKLLEEKEKEKPAAPAEQYQDFTTNISGNSIGNPYNGMKEAK